MLNLEEFRSWQDGVMVYSEAKRNLDKDKSMIQSIITDHLKQFFDFDEIDFSENFNRISLKYHKGCGAVIRADNIKNLNMDWTVIPSIDNCANRIIVIEVFPFGLPKDKEIYWVDDEPTWDDE